MKLPAWKLPDRTAVRNWVQDFRRDVIRMMRLKFICMAMAILIVVFLIMLTSINMIMNTVSRSQSMKLLKQIAESDRYSSVDGGMGRPEMPPGETVPEDMRPPEETDASSDKTAEYEAGIRPLGWGDERWQQRPGDWNDRPREDQQPPTGEDGEIAPPWENDDDFNDDHRPPEWDDDDDDDQRPTGEMPPQMTEPNPAPQTEPPAPATDPPATEPPAEPAEPAVLPVEPAVTDAPADPETDPPTEPETTQEETEATTTPPPPPSDEESGTPPPKPGESGYTGNNAQPRDPRDMRDRWNIDIILDHFAILVDSEGSFIDLRNTENYTDEEATEIMEGILAKERTEGMYGWLQFYVTDKSYGTLIVATDKTSDQGLLNNLFRATIIVGLLMLAVLLAILIVASRWITKPVQQAFTRQKQFVSDAGHELKTPIAVLTANADILQDEVGENKWLGYMQEQIGRMNQLVGDLLRLARMDNATQEYNFEDFDLSMAVAATTLPFESAAFEKHRSLEMDVQPEVMYHGSEQHIRQLCAIFIDNALKYSNENGIIKVTLLKRGDHAVLEFYNTGCEIGPDETEKIFERFYRGDKARNNKGKSGYGLGLAIAKSIMDVHKIRIQVTCEQGKWIRFLLTL